MRSASRLATLQMFMSIDFIVNRLNNCPAKGFSQKFPPETD